VTFVFLAHLLLVLDQWRLGHARRAIWSIPAAMFIWANCHGGFALGLAVLGVETFCAAMEAWLNGATSGSGPAASLSPSADRRWQTLAGVLGASLIAGLLTTNGWQSYLYPLSLMAHPGFLDHVGERLSPDFHQAQLRTYEILLIAAITCWRMSSRPARGADVMLMLALVYASLYATRYLPIFVIGCAPIVAEHAGSGVMRMQAFLCRRLPGANGGAVRGLAAASLLLALLGGIGREWQRVPRGGLFDYCARTTAFPHAAVEYLKGSHVTGHLFVGYDWGGYCLSRRYPEQKVFIDNRLDLYAGRAFEDYENISGMRPGWGDLLDEWQIDTILVRPRDGIASVLPHVGGWRVAYEDAQAKVFRRIREHA